MKQTKHKQCKNCNFCNRVYRKWGYRLWADKLYYCIFREEMTERDYTCGSWCKKHTTYDFSAQRFDGVVNDIKLMGEYLKGK